MVQVFQRALISDRILDFLGSRDTYFVEELSVLKKNRYRAGVSYG